MSGLLTFNAWQDTAIEIHCSRIKCKNILIIDSTKITGIIYCSKKCFDWRETT